MRQRSGFTLVELSIVLVIIGLLIGGILVAQSMISTAKIAATVSQIQQFDAGVENFKTKFGYLPADAPTFRGNGDGLIDFDDVSAWPKGVSGFCCDIASFFGNLFPDQYAVATRWADGGWPLVTPTGSSKNVPIAKIGKNGSYFIASAVSSDGWYADVSNPSNYYAILDSSQAEAPNLSGGTFFYMTSSTNSAVTPADLLALDQKMDDGIANTGNVISGSIGNGFAGYGGIVAVSAIGICSSGATYMVNDTGYECTPLIRIGAQTGDTQ